MIHSALRRELLFAFVAHGKSDISESWTDLSMHHRVGAVNGGGSQSFQSRLGIEGLNFAFTADDYVLVHDPPPRYLSGPSDLTIYCRFYPRSVNVRQKLIAKGSDIGGTRSLWTYEMTINSTGTFRAGFSDGSDPIDEPAAGSEPVIQDAWNVGAARYDPNGSADAFLNGFWGTPTTNQSGALNTETGVTHLGRDNNSGTGDDEFDGLIAEIAVWARVLPRSQIQRLMMKTLKTEFFGSFDPTRRGGLAL